MSEIRLVIRDGERGIWANRHGSFAESVIAALSAEPETIDELETALERFIAARDSSHFSRFSRGLDDRPHDAGVVIIDLAARLVVCESTYCAATAEGSVAYHDGMRSTDIQVNYRLSDDWMLTGRVEGWRALAEERRKERRQNPPLDTRPVLYGETLLRFIAEQCFDIFRDLPVPAEEDPADPLYQHEYDLIRDIHVRWMMTPREELRGRKPRQVVTAKRDFIDFDLQNRALQWSWMNRCPPGLDPGSAAYRLAGLGIHETVLYYDMVRRLLWQCRTDLASYLRKSPANPSQQDFVGSEVRLLEGVRETWLDSPYPDSAGRTPRGIIHNERARMPEGMAGHDAVIDDDCPLYQMQAELDGPIFWHLDGSGMDDDFAFSYWHDSIEEWEQERLAQEEFDRRFSAVWEEKKRLGVESVGGGYMDPDLAWEQSFRTAEDWESILAIRLYAIGSPLSELIVDLREAPRQSSSDEDAPSDPSARSPSSQHRALEEAAPSEEQTEQLAGAFLRLKKSVEGDFEQVWETVPPMLGDIEEALQSVADDRPDLSGRCAELRDRLRRFLEPTRKSNQTDLAEEASLPS